MNDKFCIIIDDEPQTEIIEDLVHRAKGYGLQLICEQLNPQNFLEEISSDGNKDFVINLEKIKSELHTTKYLRRKVDLILCDFGLQDKKINGFEIIRNLRNEWNYKKKIILYSATIEDVIENILKNDDKKTQRLRNLMRAEISDFCDKDYSESLLRVLREDKFSLESELEAFLIKFGDKKFRSVFPKYNGKTLYEISEELKVNSQDAIDFQKNFIENAIAHFLELNEIIDE